jgi:hypothetical protein
MKRLTISMTMLMMMLLTASAALAEIRKVSIRTLGMD